MTENTTTTTLTPVPNTLKKKSYAGFLIKSEAWSDSTAKILRLAEDKSCTLGFMEDLVTNKKTVSLYNLYKDDQHIAASIIALVGSEEGKDSLRSIALAGTKGYNTISIYSDFWEEVAKANNVESLYTKILGSALCKPIEAIGAIQEDYDKENDVYTYRKYFNI